jgi:hypothetical protein
MTTEYQPNDLSSIKKNKDVKNAVDLEIEIQSICETLKDLSMWFH